MVTALLFSTSTALEQVGTAIGMLIFRQLNATCAVNVSQQYVSILVMKVKKEKYLERG